MKRKLKRNRKRMTKKINKGKGGGRFQKSIFRERRGRAIGWARERGRKRGREGEGEGDREGEEKVKGDSKSRYIENECVKEKGR